MIHDIDKINLGICFCIDKNGNRNLTVTEGHWIHHGCWMSNPHLFYAVMHLLILHRDIGNLPATKGHWTYQGC